MKGNITTIEPGMCFSDEPMIAIYGEFGIRLEDCLYITAEVRAGSRRRVPRSISRLPDPWRT